MRIIEQKNWREKNQGESFLQACAWHARHHIAHITSLRYRLGVLQAERNHEARLTQPVAAEHAAKAVHPWRDVSLVVFVVFGVGIETHPKSDFRLYRNDRNDIDDRR